MIEIKPHNACPPKGEYTVKLRKHSKTGATVREIIIACPECQHLHTLDEHAVSREGYVSPSVVCIRCGFHDTIKLVDWEDPGSGEETTRIAEEE